MLGVVFAPHSKKLCSGPCHPSHRHLRSQFPPKIVTVISILSFIDTLSRSIPILWTILLKMWPFSESSAPVVADAPPAHPYYPLGVHIVGYAANELGLLVLLASFGAGCAAIFTASYVLVSRVRPSLPISEVMTLFWFMLCTGIHFFFEGYFAVNFYRMGGLQTLFGQLWKEYAKSDSRYLTMDPFVVCMETITAVRPFLRSDARTLD